MTKKLEKLNPKVAVFSVIRRWDDFVPKTIDSVVGQTYQNWDWYIHTGPDSEEKLEDYCKNIPQIHLIHGFTFHSNSEDMTKAPKLSQGIVDTAKKGDYLCVIDGDDRMASDFMEYQLEYMLKHDLDISNCSVVSCDSAGEEEPEEQQGRRVPQDYIFERHQLLDELPHYLMRYWLLWGKLSKSSLFEHEYYENMPLLRASNDAPIAVPALKNAKRIGLTKKVGYYYTVHTGGMSYQNFHPVRETEPFFISEIVTDMLRAVDPDSTGKNEKKIAYAGHYTLVRHILYTERALFHSTRTRKDKIKLLHYMYTRPEIKEAFLKYEGEDFKTFNSENYVYWPVETHLYNLIHLKMNFLKVFLEMILENDHFSPEEAQWLLEITGAFAPELLEFLSPTSLPFLIQQQNLTLCYFSLNFRLEPINVEELSNHMNQVLENSSDSLPLAEVLALVAWKTKEESFSKKSLTMKLKYYQEAGMMEEVMAVMDEMIAKNIQF